MPLKHESAMLHGDQELIPLELLKSPSLHLQHGDNALHAFDYRATQETGKLYSPPTELIADNITSLDEKPSFVNKSQENFEMCLPSLSKLNVKAMQRLSSSRSRPESPMSPLLTSDPRNERSHSQIFSRANIQPNVNAKESTDSASNQPPSLWRLAKLSSPEWFCAILGSLGAAVFGSFNPLLAFFLVQAVQNYRRDGSKEEVNKWCLVIVGMSVVTVIANFLQHFYFGIMGEKMTERVRRLMFSGELYGS